MKSIQFTFVLFYFSNKRSRFWKRIGNFKKKFYRFVFRSSKKKNQLKSIQIDNFLFNSLSIIRKKSFYRGVLRKEKKKNKTARTNLRHPNFHHKCNWMVSWLHHWRMLRVPLQMSLFWFCFLVLFSNEIWNEPEWKRTFSVELNNLKFNRSKFGVFDDWKWHGIYVR